MNWVSAVNRGDIETIIKFIQWGINVNTRIGAFTSATPLYICARREYDKAATVLLFAGADVHGTNHLGETPIQVASRYNNCSMVRLLLKSKADPFKKHNNLSAFDHVRKYNTHYIIYEHVVATKWRSWTKERIKQREKQLACFVWKNTGIRCDKSSLLVFF